MGGGKCPFGGWQLGKDSTKRGGIRHYTVIHESLKNEMKKAASMKRIRAADTAALVVIRTKHNRDQLEANRDNKKRKASAFEEEEDDDFELLNDLA